MGDVARAVSPHMAYQIGQYFKSNDYKNTQDNQNRPGEQSLQHLMAHAILGAATSYATEQNIGIGALSAASSEAAAPALSKFLFGKDSKELTQDEKDTITNIITLATTSTAYAITDGDVAGSVSAAELGRAGVGNNNWDGETWAYAVAGGKEYAQSQASLGVYCANQSGDFSKCIQSQGNVAIGQQAQSKNQNLPFLFYVMPEHITPFLDANQQSAARQMKPVMDFNRKAAVAAGYAPYVMSVAKELPTSVYFGSATTVTGYHVTTPENERNALGYFSNAVTGGFGGGALGLAKNTTQAIGIGSVAAYSNQVISSQGEDLSVKPSHVVNGLAYGAGKYLGGYNCGDAYQTSIIVVPNTAFGKVSDELFKYSISFDEVQRDLKNEQR